MTNVVSIFPLGFWLMLYRTPSWVPVCMCFIISYNNYGMCMMRRFKKEKKGKKPMIASCPSEPENRTDTSMCRTQWAKDLFSEVIQIKIKFPTHQSLRKEDAKGERFYENFPLETGPKRAGLRNNFIFTLIASMLFYAVQLQKLPGS